MNAARLTRFSFAFGIIFLLAATSCLASGIPDRVTINKLQKYYAPVNFDHASHISNLKDCGLCHHHTTGAQVADQNCARCHKNSGAQAVVSCQGCHLADPFTPEALKQQRDQQPPVYHRDKPGLKAAYHQSCLGCHQKMGGPVGCQDCHQRNDGGDQLFRSGKYAPKVQPAPKGNKH